MFDYSENESSSCHKFPCGENVPKPSNTWRAPGKTCIKINKHTGKVMIFQVSMTIPLKCDTCFSAKGESKKMK